LIPVWFGLRDGGAVSVEHGAASTGGMDRDLGGRDIIEEGEDTEVDVDIDVDELGE